MAIANKLAKSVISVTVNSTRVSVFQGSSVLDAIRTSGHEVQTLCYHPRFKPRAVCRLCLVEREDIAHNKKLIPACATPCQPGDTIATHTAELEHFRDRDLQFLLNRHPNECTAGDGLGGCDLQRLVQEREISQDEWHPQKELRGQVSDPHHAHVTEDYTSASISRDISKCIDCGLCVDACGEQGQQIHAIGFAERGTDMVPVTVFDRPLEETNCISCGQCTSVCPTSALTEKSDWRRVLQVLDSKQRICIVQTAPASRIAIGEEFGLPPGTVSTSRMIHALRLCGFTHVFDTNFAADLTIMEEATELLERIEGDSSRPLPMFTSCCPGWINLVEKSFPEMIPHLSTTKSPQQMHGAVTRLVYGPEAFVCSVMPCTAKKGEAERPGMKGDVDAVLTTRELARMIKARKIDFAALPNDDSEHFDSPLGESTGAAQLFGATGGVMEAMLRTLSAMLQLPPPQQDRPLEFHSVRGLDACKEYTIPGVGTVCVVNGIAQAQKMLKQPELLKRYIAVEVMACVGGCLGGGGEPKSLDALILQKRTQGVYAIDSGSAKRSSHENAQVVQLYKTHQAHPMSPWSERVLHTSYAPRQSPRDVLARFLDCVDRRDGVGAAKLFGLNGVWATPQAKVEGREGVQRFISDVLPPFANDARQQRKRHTFVDSTSLKVLSSADELCEFTIVLDPDTSRIQRMDRRVLEVV